MLRSIQIKLFGLKTKQANFPRQVFENLQVSGWSCVDALPKQNTIAQGYKITVEESLTTCKVRQPSQHFTIFTLPYHMGKGEKIYHVKRLVLWKVFEVVWEMCEN